MLNQQKVGIEEEKKAELENFFKEQEAAKKQGLQEIKDKYNQLCQ